MRYTNYIRLFAGKAITEAKMDKPTKYQLLNYVKEANIYEVISLLMDGEMQEISEQSKPVIVERFKKSQIPEKIKFFVEQEVPKKMDKKDVKQAAWRTAKKIFDKPDEKKIDDMVEKAIKKGKDTEDAIQIVINMMRGEE